MAHQASSSGQAKQLREYLYFALSNMDPPCKPVLDCLYYQAISTVSPASPKQISQWLIMTLPGGLTGVAGEGLHSDASPRIPTSPLAVAYSHFACSAWANAYSQQMIMICKQHVHEG